MTITLTSATGGPQDETARVRIDVDNPELVAERVVSSLARNFPPESVMTIAASTRTGSVDATSESSSSLQISASSSQRRHRLMREEISFDCGSGDLGPLGRYGTQQAYLVSKELDMAVPVTVGQTEIRLMDESSVSVSDGDVCTVFYDETGHACGHSRGFRTDICEHHDLPEKKGVATFVQDFVVSDSLELAVPTCPSQTCVHLVDGDVHEIDAKELHTLFYGEKGLALFTRSPDGSVAPGVPGKPGVALAAVPHRVVGDHVSVLASSTAAKAVAARDKHVNTVLFDAQGQPVCIRKPSGGLIPGALPHKEAVAWVEYYFTPSDTDARAVQMLEYKNGPIRLANGNTVTVFPDDVSYALFNETGDDIGVFVNARRPSFIAGPASAALPGLQRVQNDQRQQPHAETQKPRDTRRPTDIRRDKGAINEIRRDMPNETRRDTMNETRRDIMNETRRDMMNETRRDMVNETRRDIMNETRRDKDNETRRSQWPSYEEETSASYRQGQGDADLTRRRRQEHDNLYERPMRPDTDGLMSVTSSSRHERTRPHPTQSQSRLADAFIFSRSQHYFTPRGLDHAIPVLANQAQVKLTTGEKVKVDRSKVFWVEHDRRGLPLRTIMGDGRSRDWAVEKPGVAVKYQDFFIHDELVFAVPIVPGQMDVVVSDGSSLEVLPENIVSVYYDANGRASFSFVGKRRRIRPGLQRQAGVAESVQYFMLLDCKDGTGEKYVLPFKGHQTSVDDPFRPGRSIPVDRQNVTIVFYDERRQPLYTQLADGSLVAGGLLGSRPPTTEEEEDEATASDFDSSTVTNFEYQPSNEKQHKPSTIQKSRTVKQQSKARLKTLSSSSPSTRSKRQEIIERRVPVQQIEFVEKIVEVPEIHFVEKHVEVEQIEYETRIVKKKQIIERPVEHVKYVPKIETKIVERIIEVPQIIEVPRAEIIEQKIAVDRFIDTKEEVVVSQQFTPVIRDSADIVESVECLRLEPELIPVDVFVPKLVKNRLLAGGKSNEKRKEVDLSLGHYNSLVLKLNPTFANNYERLPMIKTNKGCFPLLPKDAKISVVPPSGDEIASLLEQTGLIARSLTDRERAKLDLTIPDHSDNDAIMSNFAPRTSAVYNANKRRDNHHSQK